MVRITKIILDIVEVLFISASITALTFLFLAQPLEVTGESMIPTFQDGEQLIVEKVSVKYKELERGEIVIVKHPGNPHVFLIKRIIGLPGEDFLIEDGNVFIDGEILSEEYLKEGTVTLGKNYIESNELIALEDGQYVMLGDNRENSIDSRTWGPISLDDIVGRSFLVFRPISNIRIAQ